MYNCLLAGNISHLGGAIYNDADATLANCTISGNKASVGGAFCLGHYSSATSSLSVLTNCIIWGNGAVFSGAQFSFQDDHSQMNLVNSCYASGPGDNTIFGIFTADANSITANPRFVAPLHANEAPTTGGDYRLDLCSPAIDAGDSSLLPPGLSEDLGFNPRIVGSAVDMGAYEVQDPQGAPVISPDATASPPSCFGSTDGSLAINVSGGAPPYSILWDTSQEGPAISGLAAGDYSATVTDASGCTGVGSFYLPEPDILEAAILEIQSASCSEAANGAALVQAAGGTPPYQYLWENGQTGGAAGGLASGLHLVTVADANGCEVSITVNIPALPFEPNLLIEQEGNTLTVAEEDTAYYRFQWINCDTGEEIPGATGLHHSFTENGVYGIIITGLSGACRDSSECVALIINHTEESTNTEPKAMAFPNPNDGRFTLALPWAAEALLHNASGRLLLREYYRPGNHQMNLSKLPAGVYFLALNRPEGMQVLRLIRQ